MEKEQPKLKECREKKNNYAFNIFSFEGREKERESESSLLLTTELQSRAKRNTIKRGAREGGRGMANGQSYCVALCCHFLLLMKRKNFCWIIC